MRYAIVGGGVAGLTFGILMAQAGNECHIFEKNALPGGNLTGWERGGFPIDNCMHWLNGTRPGSDLHRLWRRVGALSDDVPLFSPSAFYASSAGGNTLALLSDPEEARSRCLSVSGEDARVIHAFFDAVRWVRDAAATDGDDSFPLWQRLLRQGKRAVVLAGYGRKDLRGLASEFRHPLLRRLMTDYLTGGFTAAGLILSYGAFCAGDAMIPAGGSLPMAERMAKTFTGAGGILHLGVASITAETDGNVTDFVADRYVFTCDPGLIWGKLLPVPMPERLRRRYASMTLPSALQTAFSADASALPFDGTEVIPAPGLGQGSLTKERLALRSYRYDPAFVREGKTVLQSMTFLDAPTSRRWIRLRAEDPGRYGTEKAAFAEFVRRRILRAFPETEDSLAFLDTWTPATYARFGGSFSGAFMGFLHPKNTLPSAISAEIPELPNAYATGQWQSVFGGLPTAARNAAELAFSLGAQR